MWAFLYSKKGSSVRFYAVVTFLVGSSFLYFTISHLCFEKYLRRSLVDLSDTSMIRNYFRFLFYKVFGQFPQYNLVSS